MMSKQELFDTVLNIRQSLHDLAQPLAAITGLVDLLLLEMDDRDPKLPDLRRVSEQLEQALQILSDIRHMARQATAGAPLRPKPAARQTQEGSRFKV